MQESLFLRGVRDGLWGKYDYALGVAESGYRRGFAVGEAEREGGERDRDESVGESVGEVERGLEDDGRAVGTVADAGASATCTHDWRWLRTASVGGGSGVVDGFYCTRCLALSWEAGAGSPPPA